MSTLRTFLDFAADMAWQAGQLTLGHFQTGVHVDWKQDDSPVTIADKNAEQLLRQQISHRFPEHAIMGEEFGEADSDSSHRWIIDPIDGTRSFIRGVPLYAVLVGLEISGEMVLGVAHFPALKEMLTGAKGEGAWWNGRPARVSQVNQLNQALLCFTDQAAFAEHGRQTTWDALITASHTQRGWSDAYGHALVATGRAEAMFDPIMNPWDCAALLPIVQEAGGTFTNWDGQTTIYGNNAIATNGSLLQPILDIIHGE